jgi:hypothetical protein
MVLIYVVCFEIFPLSFGIMFDITKMCVCIVCISGFMLPAFCWPVFLRWTANKNTVNKSVPPSHNATITTSLATSCHIYPHFPSHATQRPCLQEQPVIL